jgi:DUF971 family protein
MQTPQNIKVHRERRIIELHWSDRVSELPFRRIRQNCPCAACVNEFTGERILDPESVPENIDALEVGFSGNYALKIKWSDSHDTGLFTWNHLRALDTPEPDSAGSEP